jgi:hypothetical protein
MSNNLIKPEFENLIKPEIQTNAFIINKTLAKLSIHTDLQKPTYQKGIQETTIVDDEKFIRLLVNVSIPNIGILNDLGNKFPWEKAIYG